MNLQLRATIPFATAILMGLAPLAVAKTLHISGKFTTEGTATTMPYGHLTGTLNTITGKVTYKITYSGLSGTVMAAHFHGPAAMGQEAGVLLPIPKPYFSGMHGHLMADAATKKAMLNGMTYVNLHTAKYPMGEARAQVKVSS